MNSVVLMNVLNRNLLSALSIKQICKGNVRFSSNTGIERTALYDFHVKHGGKMVNFGGYALPVQYADLGIPASHLHTRRLASIFDVSHMLQSYVHGKDAISCIESICTADIINTPNGSGTLTVFTNDAGGILDDLIVNRVNESLLYIVSNAAMKNQDMDIMSTAVSKYQSNGKDVAIEFLTPSQQSLIALQGPIAVATLSKLLPCSIKMDQVYFMNTLKGEIAGVPDCRITRCGYTGEDGVEISVKSEKVQHVTEAILSAQPENQIRLAGLGVRDSLRLEAGLCLYGNDIDSTTTPIEAALAWLVAKRRRAEFNFPGAKEICNQLRTGVSRRRVGFQVKGSTAPPARANMEVYHQGTLVGKITSGCPSPSLSRNIAMGYVASEFKDPGTSVEIKIRGKLYNADICRMPFVKTNYYLKPRL